MKELTTEQKARIFAMYIGCNMQCFDGLSFILRGISISPYGTIYLHAIAKFDGEYSNEKLLLKPLSAITDEDATEVARMLDVVYDNQEDSDAYFDLAGLADYLTDLFISPSDKYEPVNILQAYFYLIQHAYAVPLFIAPSHPDNGKTAIQIGLAIDATTLTT